MREDKYQTDDDRQKDVQEERKTVGWTMDVFCFFFKEIQTVRLKVKLKEERSTEGRGDGMINIGSRAPFPFPCAKYSSAMSSVIAAGVHTTSLHRTKY
jgi:hypothetical protein